MRQNIPKVLKESGSLIGIVYPANFETVSSNILTNSCYRLYFYFASAKNQSLLTELLERLPERLEQICTGGRVS